MQLTSRTASIIPPNQGKTFSFFGHTVTYKFSGHGESSRIYELTGMTSRETPPLHTHPWDEWFYFLEGEVTVQVGDRVIQATPGYVVTLPAGVPHTFAISSAHAKFLVWVSNTAAEQFIEELVEAGQEQELTVEQVKEISQKYHVRYML
jgi:quercetin dioxygenase-like cupin family protein